MDILEGLDLWHAAVIKHQSTDGSAAEGVLWCNTDDLYETIDSIQAGDAPWKCYKFSYDGPKPPNPPCWMEDTYELNMQDSLLVLEQH